MRLILFLATTSILITIHVIAPQESLMFTIHAVIREDALGEIITSGKLR
ncbi:hypothetical protein O9992_16380 [Vibrio lentus]|nr:hypothetical protein [Vibrio lentus]